MRQVIRYFGVVLLLTTTPAIRVSSQTIALVNEAMSETSLDQQKMIPLIDVLNDIEVKYQIDISYNVGLLKDKMVDGKLLQRSASSVEDRLRKILSPLHLTFERLEGKDFVIYEKIDQKGAIRKITGKTALESPLLVSASGNTGIQISSIQQTLQEMAIPIKGKVTSTAGESLPGVSVTVKGSTQGTVTDAEGGFQLSVPDETAVLVFSYIGYLTQEVAVRGNSNWTIALVEDVKSLGEVVVVGYGTQKKRDVIGSIATVNGDDIKLKSTASFDSGLQGMAAGVSVQTNSGVPGSPTVIKIRGVSSINSGTDPLWIIDGMPIYSNPGGLGRSDGTTGQSPMSLINPNDIESIQILKDAAATSIYGSRASNGVILVTTKTGKKGQGSTTFNYSTGFSSLTRTPEDIGYANTSQWFQIMDEMYQNSGKTFTMDDYYRNSPYSNIPQASPKLTREQAMAINTNWYDELFQTGRFSDYNLSSSRGFDKGSFYISGNYREDKGVQHNNNLKRISLRSNIDFSPINNLTVGARLSFAYTDNDRMQNTSYRGGPGLNGGLNSITTGALPWFPVRELANPDRYFNAYSGSNPAAFADPANVKDNLEQYRGLGGLFLNYEFPFLRGLSIRSEVSFDIIQSNNIFWQSRDIRLDGGQKPSSYAYEEAVTFKSTNYNVYSTYNRTFGLHSLNVVAGTEAQQSSQYNRAMAGQGLAGKYQEIGKPGVRLYTNGYMNGERYLLAYFGRVNYKYKDRYIFGVSARRDGSSAFTEQHRWGTFLSASAGWIISEEEFMSFLGGKTFLKLRGSYGQTGNQSIPGSLDAIKYNYTFRYGSDDILGLNGSMASTIAVDNLKWESTRSSDIGIDYGFFNNRINGSLAYYHRYVKDMLLTTPIPVSSGLTPVEEVAGFPGSVYVENSNNVWSNIGDMVNTGWELELHSINIDKGGFRWSTDFNISFNKNIIKKLTPEADNTGKGIINGPTISRKDHKRQEWFVADYAGVDPATGVPMIYALDKVRYDAEGVTTRLKNEAGQDSLIYATKTNIAGNRFYQNGKSADPTYYGGITNTLQYKGFDLSFMFSFSGGNYILDYDRQMAAVPGETKTFLADIVNNSWRKPGDQAKYPQIRYGNTYVINGQSVGDFGDEWQNHNREMYKGDYIRLRNVQIGYTLPSSVTKTLQMQGLRVYVSGSNLWTSTKYPGFDPEGAGYVYTATIPQLKTFILGLSARF
ncbi:TonB-dependent receptor [Cytophagaceae bacterium DM2B3-1]|uniref:TonB-dependent receptor n=1 Tax=Xanthocytophaga flava TaxID=3048013 RepID=A0ABT7CCW4_9BACT|nr:TonB-dependent receptor [Xanthocytophaga flavus]MDJ1470624.1 TonB-dependent receptor [Xanthocytophaga flavus]MDJ1491533.1 TonB-dependent receptor [Xanthocytophaga flavus]